MLSSLNTGLVPQSSSILIIYRYITSLAIIHYLHKSYARQYKAGSGACISLSLSPLPPEIGESGPSYWERGDPPETSLHEPSVHLPCLACRLNPHFRPSTGVRGRQAGKGKAKAGKQYLSPSVRSSQSFTIPRRSYVLPVCFNPTIRLHTALHTLRHPLPLHSQSFILASACRRRTPHAVRLSHSRPHCRYISPSSLLFDRRRRRDKAKYRSIPWPRAQSSTNLRIRRFSTAAASHQTGTLARALPLSCARYGPELLGGRAAHFIRPFRTSPDPAGGRRPRKAFVL